MVTLDMLWLPILVATVLVFAASNVIWMVLPHHKSDTRRLPEEAPVLEALGKQGLTPGLYRFPWCESMAAMKEPAYIEKLNRGPVGMLTVFPNGPFNMGRQLGLWTAYIVAVMVCVAYVTGRALGADAHYLAVFRIAGTVATLSFGSALVQDAVWWGKPVGNVVKELADALVYGLLTAGAFGWLWPR